MLKRPIVAVNVKLVYKDGREVHKTLTGKTALARAKTMVNGVARDITMQSGEWKVMR